MSGSAYAMPAYESVPDFYVISSTSNVEAFAPIHPVQTMTLSGYFNIRARASDNPQADGDPEVTLGGYFSGDLYEWVNDSKAQWNTPTGLWAAAGGNARATEYLRVAIPTGGFRYVNLYHRHNSDQNGWHDYAGGLEP